MLHKTIEKLKASWCELFHDQPMWPISGRYQCRTCLRYIAVPWETPAAKHAVEQSSHKLQVVSRTAAAAASRT